ncbi:hypothetical protein AALP_AA5G004900 [Arabis alpina]|uniref:Uncharacterized protein n=1 Tax=Arabis alpina TaxID=50452 RepID=A0A087GU19_ARAAL|nr:hypothetical protein AALP_AA5G004900 [Arabis alpina]
MGHSNTTTVNILEVVRISPSQPTDSLTLPLTFFDLGWLKLHPVDRVLFYGVPELPCSSLIPKLKSSLSSTLLHYLPLAGRLAWDSSNPKPSIVYSPDDAVYVTVAESNGDLSRLAGDKPRPATKFHPLVPELHVSDEMARIFAVQITFFPNQGFCLGVTAHHAVLDGKTMSMFLNAWAHNCKQEHQECDSRDALPYDLIPFMDRTVVQDPTGIETKLLTKWVSASNNKRSLKMFPSKKIGDEVVRVTYRLTRENIQKLRELVVETKRAELRLSTFVITYAYVITCMVKARGGDPTRLVCVGFASDFRSRLNPPLPSTYFGNCIVGTGDYDLKAEPILEEEQGLGFMSAVESVSGWVKGLCPENIEKSMLSPFEAFKRMEPGRQMISVAGSTRLGIYGSDFGWGKPVKVEIVTIDKDESVSLSESGDGTGGVEIGVSLKKDEMERFGSFFLTGFK